MGPRPRDFNEELVRRSPTFRKWEGLLPGTKLRYACRDFVKGQGDDEERLMRRIMIARRNNVRDHKALKWARRMQSSIAVKDTKATKSSASNNSQSSFQAEIGQEERNRLNMITDAKDLGKNNKNRIGRSRRETEAILSREAQLFPEEQEPPSERRTRRPTTLISDEAIREEMDVSAVESTRSYKTWLSLPLGAEFLYNQKYIKGHEAHDWLLKKNIWRRMRYRRENKKMVEEMLSREREQYAPTSQQDQSKKRPHDTITDGGVGMHPDGTMAVSKKTNSATGDLDKTIVEADAPTMVVSTPVTTAASVLGMTSGINGRNNRQESTASTASEIVDHALLSTNTDGVASAPPTMSETNPIGGDAIALPIGLSHHQQQQQQFRDQSPPVHPLHHQHHDATESAAAFAASIALAGVGIGADGDLNSHHDSAVADSAAVEAAVAAALAATDAKSNAYHLNHSHHLPHPTVNDHAGLVGVDHAVHDGNNGALATSAVAAVADCRELQSVPQMATASTTPVSMVVKTEPTNHPAAEGVVTGLGLALDAAARLAAAAAANGTCASDEAVLAATKAITTVTENTTTNSPIPIEKSSGHGSNNGTNT